MNSICIFGDSITHGSYDEEKGILFIDIFNLLNDKNLPDGLHPDTKGHEKIFEKVKDFLVENKKV